MSLTSYKSLVTPEHIIRVEEWKEFHINGELWINGQIAILKPEFKHLYNYLTGFKGFENIPVVRIGIWTKHFDNGQEAWKLDYGDGLINSDIPRKKFPSFRKDGRVITNKTFK